jgi:hypothetical protein
MSAAMPERLQRLRAKGWRMPAGAVYVGRPGRWGNPFPAEGSYAVWATVALGLVNAPETRHGVARALYLAWLCHAPIVAPVSPLARPSRRSLREAASPPPADDLIEFEGGASASIHQHCRNLAAGIAQMYAPPAPLRAPPSFAEIRRALAGRDLVCWCPPDRPCHADVLLELANR